MTKPLSNAAVTKGRWDALVFRIRQRRRAKSRWERAFLEEIVATNAEALAEALTDWLEERGWNFE